MKDTDIDVAYKLRKRLSIKEQTVAAYPDNGYVFGHFT